jgi:hypothetical protein
MRRQLKKAAIKSTKLITKRNIMIEVSVMYPNGTDTRCVDYYKKYTFYDWSFGMPKGMEFTVGE